MKRPKGLSSTAQAFTLIELLVVIGIIAALAAGVGLALRSDNPDATLRSGQGLITSALSAARGQAALTQSTSRLIVQADSSQEDFLRKIRVVVADGGNWKQVGGDITLPPGVFIVPPSTLAGVTFDDEGGDWTSGRNSTLFKTAAESVSGINDSGTWLVSKDISPLGRIDGGRIVVTAGRKTSPTSVLLFNAAAVRGMDISHYGVASLINDAASFD